MWLLFFDKQDEMKHTWPLVDQQIIQGYNRTKNNMVSPENVMIQI